MSRTDETHELQSGHDEADTRLIFHVNFIAESHHESNPVTVVCSNDTNVFVLLVYHAKYTSAKIWMDAKVNSKNTRRTTNITDLATKLTSPICDALPRFHALIGCNYTASFMRKAKRKPFEIMKGNDKFIAAISKLGDSDLIDFSAAVEEYVCAVYGVCNLMKVTMPNFL